MRKIARKIVTDEQQKPVAVLIDYADWVEIEKILETQAPSAKPTNLAHWAGTIELKEDPMELQRRWREEWD